MFQKGMFVCLSFEDMMTLTKVSEWFTCILLVQRTSIEQTYQIRINESSLWTMSQWFAIVHREKALRNCTHTHRKMKSYCWGSTKNLICLLFFMIGYLSLGALTFMLLEGGSEDALRQKLADDVRRFMQENKCVSRKFLLFRSHIVKILI